MKWSTEKDDMLIKELFSAGPWEHPSGRSQRGTAWEDVARVLNLLKGFFVNQRSVRDRYNTLITKYRHKRSKEENASGIVPEHSPIDDALEELDSLFKESDRVKDERLEANKRKGEEEKKRT